MKFHCDRCKTRYSIADDRVRGKILKIRCKNCSSVITLKEGGSVSTPRTPRQPTSDGARSSAARSRSGRRRATSTSGSALQGAFEEALRGSQVGVLPDSEPPAVLEAEWYVSQDGEQFGPFALHKAQDWVTRRQPEDELYCWSEGFDDWLPVEKVSHFRGLRGPEATLRHASGMFAMSGGRAQSHAGGEVVASNGGHAPPREETPVPLFAATLAQVVADSQPNRDDGAAAPMFGRRNGNGSSVSSLGLPSSRPPTGPGGGGGSLFASAMAAASAAPVPAEMQGQTVDDPSHDLEIGEASRVVKLPMLARNMGNAAPMGAPGLPGVGGGVSPLGRGTGTQDQVSQRASALAGLPVVQGGQSVEMPRPEILQPRRRRSGMLMPIVIGSSIVVGVVSILLYVALASEGDDARLRRGDVGGKGGLAYQFDDPDRDKKGEGKTTEPPARSRRSVRRPTTSRNTTTSTTAAPTQAPTGPDFDEVDLSGNDAPRELDADDVFDVLNANRIGVQMCYNSALKRDPLLKVRRADVAIRVGPSGAVSSVSIPSLSGTQLGLCLEKRIRAWKFPRATEAFNSRFPIVFQNS